MSDIMKSIDDRIVCEPPEQCDLSAEEAEVYSRAFLNAERSLVYIWEMQQERMDNREVPTRLTRRERNSLSEFITGLSRSITILNTFEETGRVEKLESDIRNEEIRAEIADTLADEELNHEERHEKVNRIMKE